MFQGLTSGSCRQGERGGLVAEEEWDQKTRGSQGT